MSQPCFHVLDPGGSSRGLSDKRHSADPAVSSVKPGLSLRDQRQWKNMRSRSRSSCIPKDKGVIRTITANHVVAIEISTLAMRLRPMNSRKTRAPTKGATAVATRACGLNFAKRSPGNIPQSLPLARSRESSYPQLYRLRLRFVSSFGYIENPWE
jgi:hypothetical protein